MLTPVAAAVVIVLVLLLVAVAVYGPQWFGREQYTVRGYHERETPQTPPWANTGDDPQHADWPETEAVAEGRAYLRGDLGRRETPPAERARLRCGYDRPRDRAEPSAATSALHTLERGTRVILHEIKSFVDEYILGADGDCDAGRAEHYGPPPGRQPAPKWPRVAGTGTRTRAPREGSTVSAMLDLIERSA